MENLGGFDGIATEQHHTATGKKLKKKDEKRPDVGLVQRKKKGNWGKMLPKTYGDPPMVRPSSSGEER